MKVSSLSKTRIPEAQSEFGVHLLFSHDCPFWQASLLSLRWCLHWRIFQLLLPFTRLCLHLSDQDLLILLDSSHTFAHKLCSRFNELCSISWETMHYNHYAFSYAVSPPSFSLSEKWCSTQSFLKPQTKYPLLWKHFSIICTILSLHLPTPHPKDASSHFGWGISSHCNTTWCIMACIKLYCNWLSAYLDYKFQKIGTWAFYLYTLRIKTRVLYRRYSE